MKSSEIRNKFLEFFKAKNHEIVPSDTLGQKNDPSLLFTSAGMNQFKDQFMGRHITYKRAASCQKCLRTGDLENVGKTSGHHTFFEMLGNFSFGDYFKKEACLWAWEFMTRILGIRENKLWISVYKDDDEAYRIWLDVVRVPKDRIVKLGAKDNFWPQNAPLEGPNGLCGPCSEIFYDWGKETGCGRKDCTPSCDCGRFTEVWNLVFTQFNRTGKNNLKPLPSKNIDTGMGLERITAVMQGVKTNFETDLFKPIIEKIKALKLNITDQSQKAIADHLRAAVFAIGDGISPSNKDAGYVIRKLITRSSRLANTNEICLYKLVPCLVKIMEGIYPRLKEIREDITSVIKAEEERYQITVGTSLPRLKKLIEEYSAKKDAIPGEKIFKLVDTYGLPLDVIASEIREAGCEYDFKGFDQCMKRQRELSRDKSKIEAGIFGEDVFKNAPRPKSSKKEPLDAVIAFMESGGVEIKGQALKPDKVYIMTSPQCEAFYTEAGGQVGDSGIIRHTLDGSETTIVNTRKVDGRIIHECIIGGQLAKGVRVRVILNKERKEKIAANHTATHLLHSALRQVLGEHVHQSGSHVDEKRLRFDFTHTHKLSDREIERIEGLVNEKIKQSESVKKDMKSRKDAEKEGAIALFGEKYGETVMVVSIGDYSKELCGGTHIENTKEIGLFKIARESSIAAGIRRIEAVTGENAKLWMDDQKNRAREMEKSKKKKEEEKLLYRQKMKEAQTMSDEILSKAKDINGVKVILEEIKDADLNLLRKLSDSIKAKNKSTFIVLASKRDDKAICVLSISEDLVKKGMDSGTMIKEIAALIGGSGGGRKEFAQAGGKNVSKIKEALAKAEELFSRSKI